MAAVDLVLDCTDNFATREAVNVACVRAGKPLVSGAAIRLEGQLSVFDTRRDESPCYHCLYGHGSEAELTCSEAGVIGPLVGLVGSLQALEALCCWPVSANRWWAACCWWTPSARASANCGCVAILPVPSAGNAMAVESAAVGVFDSGVGGLSVLREIRARLPSESLLYVADNAHVPYGEKSAEYIRERCERIGDFLLEQGAKALVLACNTATAAAAAELRERYPQVPLVAMEPAVKPAAAATRNGRVGVLATTGTLKSARFAALLDRFASDVQVFTQPCPGLVERIEAGDLYGPQTRALLERLLAPILEQGCDTLILGCTHYPFVKPLLAELIPAEMAVIDTGAAVARQLERVLSARALLASGQAATPRFWTSALPEEMERILPILWGSPESVGKLVV